MLAKDYRLNLRFEPDYKNQFSRITSPSFVCLFQKDDSLTHSKLSILVSKRLSSKAVDRNAHRRSISGIVERSWNQIPTPYKIVLIPKYKLDLSANTLEQEVTSLLKRIG